MADKFIELQEMLGVDSTGKPLDRSYLQAGLPADLQQSIENLENVTNWLHVDLLQDELYADINAAFICKEISAECADYLPVTAFAQYRAQFQPRPPAHAVRPA